MGNFRQRLQPNVSSQNKEPPWEMEDHATDAVVMPEPPAETKAPSTALRVRTPPPRRMTETERMLWPHLDHLVSGRSRFRKWENVGSHVADFACHRTKIVIRLNRLEQGLSGLREADAAEAAWQKLGYRVLRFWNAEVMGDIEFVLDTIQAAIVAAHGNGPGDGPGPGAVLPPPDPSPSGRGA